MRTQTRKLTLCQNVPFMFIFFHFFDTTSDSRFSLKKWVISPIMFSVSFKLICYICLIMIELIRLVYLVLCPCGRCAHLCVLICVCVCLCVHSFPLTVSQQSGMLSNLGTTISSPNSEPDNHALLDEKEDSYFSEIRNFISNSEMNQASSSTDKR